MSRRLALVFGLILAAVLGGAWYVYRNLPQEAVLAALDPEHARIATLLLDRLAAGEYDRAHAMFSTQMAEALPVDELRRTWEALPAQLGELAGRGGPRGESVGGVPVVSIRLPFAKMPLDARIAVGDNGTVTGFRLVPARAMAEPLPADAPIVELQRQVAGLPATLTLPREFEGKLPAVVLVHGSGPHDRDQTIGPNRPLRDLAHGLAERGIVALRFDKRSLARPGDFGDGAFTIDRETTDDAAAAVGVLRNEPAVDPARVFVLGHSQGAMMGPRIAQRAPEVTGLILAAAPARPLDELVLDQVRYLAERDGAIDEKERAALDEMARRQAAVRALGGEGEPDGPLLLDLPAAYWRDLAGYDPVAVAGALPQPMLVLHGGRDYQVTDADFARWREAFADSERVTLKRYPRLDHLLIAGEGASTPEGYLTPGHVDARVIDDIAHWIEALDKP